MQHSFTDCAGLAATVEQDKDDQITTAGMIALQQSLTDHKSTVMLPVGMMEDYRHSTSTFRTTSNCTSIVFCQQIVYTVV